MAYGDVCAIMTTYGDMYFCIPCATALHAKIQHKVVGDGFWKWLRDLDKTTIPETDATTQRIFLHYTSEGHCRDWNSADEDARMVVLSEGHYPDQEELNENSCECCMQALETWCTDYP